MTCQHCNAENSNLLPFGRALDGGRAYAQTCTVCGRVLGLRPRLESDPPANPSDLSDEQIARLQFVRWRLGSECIAQIRPLGDTDSPLSAA